MQAELQQGYIEPQENVWEKKKSGVNVTQFGSWKNIVLNVKHL